MFSSMDPNGNNVLSLAEVQKFMKDVVRKLTVYILGRSSITISFRTSTSSGLSLIDSECSFARTAQPTVMEVAISLGELFEPAMEECSGMPY